MKIILSFLFVALFVSSFAVLAGEDFVCDNNGEKRIIKISYQNDQQPVPCEVKYDKGQGEETLWSAQSEVGFCEAKADEFIQKQESWGWSCEKFQAPVDEVPLEELHTSLY
ncbi:MAG: hypothetical protein R8G33_02855 [Gammaproteobacteria bacterium]|nr:hypothetical protein [Gammaproteobacteria bacterium]